MRKYREEMRVKHIRDTRDSVMRDYLDYKHGVSEKEKRLRYKREMAEARMKAEQEETAEGGLTTARSAASDRAGSSRGGRRRRPGTSDSRSVSPIKHVVNDSGPGRSAGSRSPRPSPRKSPGATRLPQLTSRGGGVGGVSASPMRGAVR